MANTKFKIFLEIFFLKFNNVDVLFNEEILTLRTCTTNETLSTTKQIQIINIKNFVIAAMDVDSKTFVIHIAIWEQEKMLVHYKKQVQVGALIFNKVLTAIPMEYSNYSNILVEYAIQLPEYIKKNNHYTCNSDPF